MQLRGWQDKKGPGEAAEARVLGRCRGGQSLATTGSFGTAGSSAAATSSRAEGDSFMYRWVTERFEWSIHSMIRLASIPPSPNVTRRSAGRCGTAVRTSRTCRRASRRPRSGGDGMCRGSGHRRAAQGPCCRSDTAPGRREHERSVGCTTCAPIPANQRLVPAWRSMSRLEQTSLATNHGPSSSRTVRISVSLNLKREGVFMVISLVVTGGLSQEVPCHQNPCLSGEKSETARTP